MGSSRDGYVLVVGATHPDIFADYRTSQADRIDKIGELTYSIGGTAYNVAVNLGQNHVDVALFTYVKRDSLFTDLILERLERNGVRTNFVQYDRYMPESGFVAIREDGDLISAVTASGITEVVFDREALERAVEGASIVVADCNLTGSQLDLVVDLADRFDTRTFVCGVSESKSARVREVSGPITLFSLNREEAQYLLECDELRPDRLRSFAAENDVHNLVVTQGADGYLIATPEAVDRFPAPPVTEVASTSGAGDAFLAGVCHSVHDEGALRWESIHDSIASYVTAVLEREGSTVGAVANENELSVRDRINRQVRAIAGYSRWEKAAMAIGAVSAVLTILSFLLGAVSLPADWWAVLGDAVEFP